MLAMTFGVVAALSLEVGFSQQMKLEKLRYDIRIARQARYQAIQSWQRNGVTVDSNRFSKQPFASGWQWRWQPNESLFIGEWQGYWEPKKWTAEPPECGT